MHTGYKINASVKYPSIGSVSAMELGDAELDLPAFVSIGPGSTAGPGFLGMTFAPLAVQDAERMPRHVALPGGLRGADLKRRLGLLEELERDFAESGGRQLVTDHREVYQTAAQLVSSPRLSVFDLGQEPDKLRDAYGRTTEGQGCLLARRLIEAGVTFVEVNSGGVSATTNWDTHTDNFEGHKRQAPAVDTALSALIQDLKERGMLDRTLVICMGEFGRTPAINGNAGRDHFARCLQRRPGRRRHPRRPGHRRHRSGGDRGGLAPRDDPGPLLHLLPRPPDRSPPAERQQRPANLARHWWRSRRRAVRIQLIAGRNRSGHE